MNTNSPAYILKSARIPFVKSQTAYANYTRQDLMTAALNGLVKEAHLENQLIGDVAFGAVMNSVSNFNLAREIVLSTALHPHTPAYNVQRACGTGLETTWQIALKINCGAIPHGISGGVDSNSDLPIEVSRPLQLALLNLHKAKSFIDKLNVFKSIKLKDLKPKISSVNEPRTGLSMGEHCELMVKEWQITREEQDSFALLSHHRAAKAYETGFYEDLVVPFASLKQDGTVRGDTSMEKLAKLKPAFDFEQGSLTAGNSSPLTDGAATVLLGSEEAAKLFNLPPLARLIDVQVAAVDFVKGEGLLMAPTIAVSNLLQRHNLTFEDFDFIEIHEAFAGQVLCNLKAWESDKYCKNILGRKSALGPIDRNKINVMGSSLAVGHPFAATGARIVGTLAKLLSGKPNQRGLISICTAGGMGIAALLESI